MRRPTATGRTTNTFNLNQPPALSIGRSERPLISTHGEMIAIIVIRTRVRSLGLEHTPSSRRRRVDSSGRIK
ncbi:11531_t:CDS:2 [Paraglomus brasilianum]|uniref:11531_t:CDS:1 n=1 Tax=Paraglomus brasilianum TaxID=144538 RepID=A0A9N8VVJ6_9GLOM|nr:11531_t:CDS:2 [Paraglomus brasilianum]